jgi:hypothetical protein
MTHRLVKVDANTAVFDCFLCSVKDRNTSAMLEYAMRTVNCLCRATAVDNRVQVCYLGEQIFLPVLHVWNSKPCERVKVRRNFPFIHIYLLYVFDHILTDGKVSAAEIFDIRPGTEEKRKLSYDSGVTQK